MSPAHSMVYNPDDDNNTVAATQGFATATATDADVTAAVTVETAVTVVNNATTNEDEDAGEPKRINTDSLTGLRGLVVLHIVISHYSAFSRGKDLLGGASMSLFYLLSGFIMTVGYVASDQSERAVRTKTRSDAKAPL